MNSMVDTIGEEMKRLEEIDVKNSDIIHRYVDGQVGLLELKRYGDVSRNKGKI
jgi:hypothetical protein